MVGDYLAPRVGVAASHDVAEDRHHRHDVLRFLRELSRVRDVLVEQHLELPRAQGDEVESGEHPRL